MDPVPNPIGRPGLPADEFFKQGVEGNQPGTRFFCQFTDKDGQIGQFVAAETAVVELIARTRMPRFVPRGPSSPFLFREKASGQLAQHATKSPHNTNLILRIITPQHGLD